MVCSSAQVPQLPAAGPRCQRPAISVRRIAATVLVPRATPVSLPSTFDLFGYSQPLHTSVPPARPAIRLGSRETSFAHFHPTVCWSFWSTALFCGGGVGFSQIWFNPVHDRQCLSPNAQAWFTYPLSHIVLHKLLLRSLLIPRPPLEKCTRCCCSVFTAPSFMLPGEWIYGHWAQRSKYAASLLAEDAGFERLAQVLYREADKWCWSKKRLLGWLDGWMDGWLVGWLDIKMAFTLTRFLARGGSSCTHIYTPPRIPSPSPTHLPVFSLTQRQFELISTQECQLQRHWEKKDCESLLATQESTKYWFYWSSLRFMSTCQWYRIQIAT